MKKPDAIDRLLLYRLENDLSFDQLADEISALGKPMDRRSLYLILRRHTTPTDRSLFKLERFLRHLDEQAANGNGVAKKPARRRRTRKAA